MILLLVIILIILIILLIVIIIIIILFILIISTLVTIMLFQISAADNPQAYALSEPLGAMHMPSGISQGYDLTCLASTVWPEEIPAADLTIVSVVCAKQS